MLKRITLYVLLFALLSACAPVVATDTPVVTESPFGGSGSGQPTLPPVVVTDTPLGQQTLEPIPVHVGYGAKGSFFEIYFTDPANPASNQETGGVEQALIASIDAARLSVDVAIYSLSLREVGNALLRARDRGVAVRVVMESDNRERSVPQALMDGGLPILGDRREGLMHDKFVIIDRSEVWMGSLNFTVSGAYEDNNNLVHIRSVKIAENYTAEFEEMYTEDLFGPDASAMTPNPSVTVDNIQIETYFSPDDGVAAHLVELLQGAQESIYFMAYSFTSDDIANAVRERASAGVTVAGVMDDSQAKSNQGTEYDPFRQAGLDVRLDGNKGLMHHKVLIIDRSIVVTGSYNFTGSAEDRNDENLIVFYSPDIAEFYLAEFQRVFGLAQLP
jgi:phosphatidylserine/phosphatidylglycerophosphate/cardiolipin synthase-like enzyme